MILFAYASNMNVDELAWHFKSAKKITNGFLPHYRLVFNRTGPDQSAKANIEQSNELGAVVWGVLIQMSPDDATHLYDPNDDTLKLHPVECQGTDGKTYAAEVFISTPHATNNYLLPYDWYVKKITTFARQAGLPEEYVNSLEQAEAKPDPDGQRSARRLKKLADPNAILYNQALADRVREMIAATGEERVEERRMFGGLCFMVDDKICVAVGKNRMLVRLDPAVYPAALEMEGTTPMQRQGTVMTGYLHVNEEFLTTQKELFYWVNLALEFNPRAVKSKR